MEVLETEDERTYFKSGVWLGYVIHVGDCVYINPEAFDFDYEKEVESKQNKSKKVRNLFCLYNFS